VGADFVVFGYRIESYFRFRSIECLEGGQVWAFAYDLHFLGVTLGKVAYNAGKAVVVAEAKMAKKEEAHFLLKEAICYRAGWFRLVKCGAKDTLYSVEL
jgi:hypothetical protein